MFEYFDHTLRFKSSSNAGRCQFFALSNVPVIAEVTPSVCQFIENNYSGFLYMNDDDLLYSFSQAEKLSLLERSQVSQRLLASFSQATKSAYADLLFFLKAYVRGFDDQVEPLIINHYAKAIFLKKIKNFR